MSKWIIQQKLWIQITDYQSDSNSQPNIEKWISDSFGTYFTHRFLEIFTVRKGRILDLSPVVVDSVDGVPQKGGDM